MVRSLTSLKITTFNLDSNDPMQDILKTLNIHQEQVFAWISTLALNIVLSIIILCTGFWIAKRLSVAVAKLLERRDADKGLITFLSNFTSVLAKVITVFMAISQLGIAMTSFVTILGAAGIAFGVAFGGILSNFAGGILILVIKPFKLKDTIGALAITGEVIEIQMFNTYLKTDDNKVVVLPNGPLINGVITNFTREGRRRIDLIIPVPYRSNLGELQERIKTFVESQSLVLKDPEPALFFSEFDHQSGKLTIHCWVETVHYSAVHRTLSNAIFPWIESVPQSS
ncbi:MAG: mechanosensitive ion channel [Bacteroidetes bacterium]|nr:mechanosensitive ion channel [Bacteroidota bacterium]